MATYKRQWAAEKREMEKMFYFLLERPTKIIDIVPPEDDLGYTSSDGKIHLAYDHPMMDSLSNPEKVVFRNGVFAHEALHQYFTDFKSFELALELYKGAERRIFATLFNVLEDPAIEWWGRTVISGPLLNSLKFMVSHIYRESPNIDEAKTPFSQYMSALIQFGDMGLIKGEFTFPEAHTMFAKTAGLFDEGIKEPDPAMRVEYAKRLLRETEPLWKARAEAEDFMDELAQLMSELGKSAPNGHGSGTAGDPSAVTESSKESRRRITIKKVSKEEMEKLKEETKEAPTELPEGDITLYVCEEDMPEEDPSGKSSISSPIGDKEMTDESAEKTPSGESCATHDKGPSFYPDGASGDGEGDGEMAETVEEPSDSSPPCPSRSFSSKSSNNCGANGEGNAPSDANSKTDTEKENEEKAGSSLSSGSRDFRDITVGGCGKPASPSENMEDESTEEPVIDDEEYRISDEDVDSIIKKIEESEEEIKKEEERETDASEIDNYDIGSHKMPRRSCLNYRVTIDSSNRARLEKAYADVVSKLSVGIRSTTKALKRIFDDDKEAREYRSSGNISIKKLSRGTLSDNMFEKKISPADKKDLCVEILVDESGSMGCSGKYIAARESCIALAEIFKALDIPVYVIGFTADCNGYGIVHSHYITWKNTREDRLKLLNISARNNNCDGGSIRYATEIIKKAKAKNKLLIVLSDGQPAAHNYSRGNEDTKDAIREAKKHASVLGVAIGNNDTETIQFFYEKDFLHVGDVTELFSGLARAIKNIIKKW